MGVGADKAGGWEQWAEGGSPPPPLSEGFETFRGKPGGKRYGDDSGSGTLNSSNSKSLYLFHY